MQKKIREKQRDEDETEGEHLCVFSPPYFSVTHRIHIKKRR